MTRKKDSKQYQEYVNNSIYSLERDAGRQFKVEKHFLYGWSVSQTIENKDHWVFSGETLADVHTYLWVLYNFLQTERLAQPDLKFCDKCNNVKHLGECFNKPKTNRIYLK